MLSVTSWLVLTTVWSSTSGSDLYFNAKEIHSAQYDVKIVGQPVVTGGETAEPASPDADTEMVTMTNKFGQKYQCVMPFDSDAAGKNEAHDAEAAKEDDGLTLLTTENIQKLLNPMMEEPCLVRTKDWWSYEFCYGGEIRQYHMEDGKPSGKIMSLGKFDRDDDWSNSTSTAESDGKSKDTPKVRYHAQWYTNGSLCDLTESMRTTEVRVSWGEGSAGVKQIG